MYRFVDHELSRRLEGAEGTIGIGFAEARRRLQVASASNVISIWRDFGGVLAVVDGATAQLTQTFGLGLNGSVSAQDLDVIEAFFRDRGAEAAHEVSPLAGAELLTLLHARGYAPIELTNVLVHPLDAEANAASSLSVSARKVASEEADAWISASCAGWGQSAEDSAHAALMATLAFGNPAMTSFVVESGGEMIATASLGIHDGIALLAGASTVPSARGRGAQRALLEARIAEAIERHCELAMVCAEPGSASQRNAERSGFRVAYTRMKWRQPGPP